MYTHPYIHSSNENSRVDSSRSSSQGSWLGESRSAFTRILAHQPPGQLPLPHPPSREAARMSVRPGASSSQRPKAESKCQHRRPFIPGDQESLPVRSAPPAPPLGWSRSPILRPLSLLGRKPTLSSFPLPLHFLPSHLPSSPALLFTHFPSPLRQPHPTSKSPQPLKFSLFMAWSQTS